MKGERTSWATRLLPSLSDVVFLLPLFLMLTRMNGVTTMLCDGDTGWHIRTGEWILDHGMVPHSDIFSFTRPGQPWFAWEWMWDVMFAWFYRHGGLATVVLAGMFVISLTYTLLFRFLRARGNTLVAMAVTVLATAGSAIHWMARPHVVTLLLVVVFHRMLERVREGRGTMPAWLGGVPYLAAMPVLMVLWTNLHGGFFVGITLVAAYGGGELVRMAMAASGEERRAAWHRAAPYLLSALGCAAASLINPYSFQLHRHILGYLSRSYEAANIVEFYSLNFHHPLAPFFETMLLLGAGSVFWNLVKRRFEYVIAVAVWAHAALLAARNIPIFMTVAAPIVASAVEEWLAAIETAAVPEWLRRIQRAVLRVGRTLGEGESLPRVHALSAAAFLALAWLVYGPSPAKLFRPEYDPKAYPARAIERAALADPGARIFTSDEWGDYLIFKLYPRTRVFIDGRSDFYGEDFGNRFLEVWRVKYDWEKTLAGYGVNTILLPPNTPLAGALKESHRWRVDYDDGVALVFRPADAVRAAGERQSAAQAGRGEGRDREITKTQARGLTITQSQSKPKS